MIMLRIKDEAVADGSQGSRRPSAAEGVAKQQCNKKMSDRAVASASQITTRQSLVPVGLVTILFFLWHFAYGFLGVLNKHFQEVLGVTQGQGSRLAAAYFGAYFVGPLTYSGWIVRHFGYRWTFVCLSLEVLVAIVVNLR